MFRQEKDADVALAKTDLSLIMGDKKLVTIFDSLPHKELTQGDTFSCGA